MRAGSSVKLKYRMRAQNSDFDSIVIARLIVDDSSKEKLYTCLLSECNHFTDFSSLRLARSCNEMCNRRCAFFFFLSLDINKIGLALLVFRRYI